MEIGFARVEKEGVVYYTIPAFERTGLVKTAFSTRLGGVSSGHCASMNLGFGRGDSRENVLKNYQILCAALDIDPASLVLSRQIHTDTILKVGTAHRGIGLTRPPFEDADGLMSDEPGVTLTTFYADCVPLYLFDPVKKAIAGVHSGWRGTVLGIGAKAVRQMGALYGSRPADILAAVGPCIGPCHYEVSLDVKDAFLHAYGEKAQDYFTPGADGDHVMLDLWRANETILRDAGVRDDHLASARLCTYCHAEELFSHRQTKGKRGVLAALIALC